MKRLLIKSILGIIILFIIITQDFFPKNNSDNNSVIVNAYIDPGSLNVIWQFLAALLFGLVTVFSFMKNKIKLLFSKLFNKNKNKKQVKEPLETK